MKTLYFEGAGCVPRGDVENCRIRTAFRNRKGKPIYLELSGFEVTDKTRAAYKPFTNVCTVDHCFIIGFMIGEQAEKDRLEFERKFFEYSKAEILAFVNENLDCDFDEIRVVDMFYGYHVHAGAYGYNLMEDHTFDDDKAERAKAAFDYIDMDIRKRLNEKYSKISLVKIHEDHITVQCYASDKALESAGLKRFYTVYFDGRVS